MHEARWNAAKSAVEMHLVSLKQQAATIAGQRFAFRPGETIHTESSRKYSMQSFSWLAMQSGWRVDAIWTDPQQRFALLGLCVA